VFRILLVGLFSTIAIGGSAQNAELDQLARAQYVERFPDYFFIWPVLKRRAPSFTIQKGQNGSQKLIYRPNVRYYAGFGTYLFEMGFQLSFALPPSSQSIEEFGKSKASDIQLNIVGKNWGMDLSEQIYKGYYIDDRINPIPSGQPKPKRPDIETRNFGGTGIYFFNKNRYSLRATFNYFERQLKSAGSFLIAGTVTKFSMHGDSVVFGSTYEPAFGAASNFSKMNCWTIGSGPGYGYNLVLNKRMLLGFSLAIGPSINWMNYATQAEPWKSALNVHLYTDMRISLSYNSERLFAGLSFIRQAREIQYAEAHFTNTNDALRLAIGYRFEEVGFLKYRVRDLFKAKSR